MEFWFSATGEPATVVSLGLSVMYSSLSGLSASAASRKRRRHGSHHREPSESAPMRCINPGDRKCRYKKTEPKARFFYPKSRSLLGCFHFTSDRTVNQLDVSHRCVVTSAETALE